MGVSGIKVDLNLRDKRNPEIEGIKNQKLIRGKDKKLKRKKTGEVETGSVVTQKKQKTSETKCRP